MSTAVLIVVSSTLSSTADPAGALGSAGTNPPGAVREGTGNIRRPVARAAEACFEDVACQSARPGTMSSPSILGFETGDNVAPDPPVSLKTTSVGIGESSEMTASAVTASGPRAGNIGRMEQSGGIRQRVAERVASGGSRGYCREDGGTCDIESGIKGDPLQASLSLRLVGLDDRDVHPAHPAHPVRSVHPRIYEDQR